MSGPVLGIDLGTTNSAVAVADGRESRVLADPDGRRLIPSVVSFHPDGSILVGHEARERRLVDATNTVYSIKRLIGRPFQSSEVQRAKERLAFGLEATAVGGVQVRVRRGTFALPEISAMVLRHLRSVAETALGEACQRAVITVPANFNELQRSATQAAGRVAGLDVMRILNEPTAATLAYGYARDKAETIAVYDLGGGTFDLTVLDLDDDVFEVVATAGDTFLGGDDIDVLIAERMAARCLKDHRYDPKQDPQTFERLRAAAEWAKCQLSAAHDVEVTIEELLHDSSGREVNFHFRMTRLELEELALPLLTRSFDVVSDALRSAGRRPKEIKSVVLVGGSTRMPMVRRMVSEFFHREPQADIDPDLVVAQGAAIHGFTLAGEKRASSRPVAQPKAIAKVPLKPAGIPPRKQPAFAPEDPRDIAPRIEPAKRVAQVALRRGDDDRPARRVGGSSDPLPLSRGDTSPYGLDKAAASAADAGVISESIDDLDAEPTRMGTYPKAPSAQDLSTPFVEPPSTVAVIRSQAVGVSAPAKAEPLSAGREKNGGLLDLDEPKERPAPPPTPPARAPDREQIQAALFGGKPKPFAEAMPLPPEPTADPALDPAWRGPPQPGGGWGGPPAPVHGLPAPQPPSDAGLGFKTRPPSVSPQALSPRQPSVAMPDRPAPLLMDVTPLALGLETAGGYVQHLVNRNAPIPTEKTRVFSTARDDQTEVEVRICQGDSNVYKDNEALGAITLSGLRKTRRGEIRIEVTFMIDASGILDVKATDLDTRRAQALRVALQGGIDQADVDQMRQRQERELFPAQR